MNQEGKANEYARKLDEAYNVMRDQEKARAELTEAQERHAEYVRELDEAYIAMIRAERELAIARTAERVNWLVTSDEFGKIVDGQRPAAAWRQLYQERHDAHKRAEQAQRGYNLLKVAYEHAEARLKSSDECRKATRQSVLRVWEG